MFSERNELLALSETKLKGNGEVNGILVGAQEIESAREGVAIFMNNVWHSAVIDFRC